MLAELDRTQVGVCFDSSHASYGGRFWEELTLLAPFIIGTHLSDNDALPGGAWEDRHWFPFAGMIDWPRVIRELTAHSPCPCAIVEVLDRGNPRITPALMESYQKIATLISAEK